MKIGIIGAENSHTEHFCRVINDQNQFPGHRVAYLFGADAPEIADRLAGQYGLILCQSEDELIEKADGVVITYRRGSAHFEPAMKALREGKPLFNDKPFAVSNEEAEALIDYAQEHKSLLCGGSNLKGLPGLAGLTKQMGPGKTAVVSFGGDINSPYDGYWFYGIHSAELCICLCGEDFLSVDSFRNGTGVISVVHYADRSCIISTNPDNADLHISITGPAGTVHQHLPLQYQSVGPAEFIHMVETGRLPRSLSHYSSATRLVCAIIDSLNRTKTE